MSALANSIVWCADHTLGMPYGCHASQQSCVWLELPGYFHLDWAPKSRRDRGSGIGFDILHTRPPLRKNSFGYLLSLLIIVATLLLDSAVVATPLH